MPLLPAVEEVWQDDCWRYLTPTKINLLRINRGSLLRYASAVDGQAEIGTHKGERRKLASLGVGKVKATLDRMREDVSRRPAFVREEPARG